MTLNKDLFLELCHEYGVQFSKNYNSIMLDDDGNIRELRERDVDELLLSSDSVPYNDSEFVENKVELNILQIASSAIDFLPDSLLVAA